MNKNTGIVGEPRLQFIDFKLLHDTMDDLCKKITIQIPAKEVTEKRVKSLKHLLGTIPGTQSLHFTIWDEKEKIELNLPSRIPKIKITNEFLAQLEKEQIDFKLN